MIVVHLAYFMEPVLLGRVEGLVRRSATRSLAMTGDSVLPRGLPATPLMPQENGRPIRVVCVDIIEQLSAMMVHTRGLPGVRLLLTMLLEANFRERFAVRAGRSALRWGHRSGHVGRVDVVDRVGALTRIKRSVQVLFRSVFAIELLRSGDDAARIVQRVVDQC